MVDAIGLWQTNTLRLNVPTGEFTHPSIDQIQDPWQECNEISTWEGWYRQPVGETEISIRGVYARPTWTDNRGSGGYDSVGESGAFYELTLYDRNDPIGIHSPSISVTQARDSGVTPERPQLASVCFNGISSSGDTSLNEVTISYYASTLEDLRTFTYAGRTMSNSVCKDTGVAPGRAHAVLYRSALPGRPLLTTREFFLARTRPTGYRADGRSLAISLDDSTGSQLILRAHDAYMADDVQSIPLRFVPRPARRGRVDSLAQLRALLRTGSFIGHDSTLVSLQLGGTFAGDTIGWRPARLVVVADLVDSSTGAAVARLDSFVVSTVSSSYQTIERTLDLLSGTYYVRVSIDTAGFVPVGTATQEPYRLGVITEFVPSSLGKLVRSGPAAGTDLRISVQPNPADRTAEMRFSVPDAQHVRVRLTDLWGKDIRVLPDEPELAAGRYALPVDVSGLAPGAYIVEVVTDRSAARCKLSVGGR